jgi:hypothetical protein
VTLLGGRAALPCCTAGWLHGLAWLLRALPCLQLQPAVLTTCLGPDLTYAEAKGTPSSPAPLEKHPAASNPTSPRCLAPGPTFPSCFLRTNLC